MFNQNKQKNKGGAGGGKVDILVRFQGQEGVAIPAYRPGETMMGVITLEPNREMNVNGVDIQLKWETQGKGDRNQQVMDEDHIEIEKLMPGDPVKYPFSFSLPQLPWTYEGELIRVVWSVYVQVDVSSALDLFNMMDVRHSEPFVMRPY